MILKNQGEHQVYCNFLAAAASIECVNQKAEDLKARRRFGTTHTVPNCES